MRYVLVVCFIQSTLVLQHVHCSSYVLITPEVIQLNDNELVVQLNANELVVQLNDNELVEQLKDERSMKMNSWWSKHLWLLCRQQMPHALWQESG